MALGVNKDGAANVKIALPGASLQQLGYTTNGVNVRSEAFFDNIPGDEKGGDRGPPIEIQYFGEIALVRLELSKYDPVVAAIVEARLASGTAGTPGTSGTLMFAEQKYLRLLIEPTVRPRNFPVAIVRGAIELNKGTRYSTFVCDLECHDYSSGVLWNNSTS